MSTISWRVNNTVASSWTGVPGKKEGEEMKIKEIFGLGYDRDRKDRDHDWGGRSHWGGSDHNWGGWGHRNNNWGNWGNWGSWGGWGRWGC
jgi:hypothetical protein